MAHPFFWCLLPVLLASGCSGRAAPEARPDPSPSPPPPAPQEERSGEPPGETIRPTPDPVPAPTDGPESGAGEEAGTSAEERVRERVLAFAAEELSFPRESCTLRRLERRDWPDSSLGCGKPGEVYLTVETPGYLAEVQTPSGLHRIHTDLEARRLVVCDEDD